MMQSPAFTVAIPKDLRNALRNLPWRRNQSVSERQNRVERQTITGAPKVTIDAKSRAVRLRSATLFGPEKFDNAPSNNAPRRRFDRPSVGRRSSGIGGFPGRIIPSGVSQATTETSNRERNSASSLVLQLSARIASPGRKVSARTSQTAPRWVPILEREKRSSYLPASLSNATIV
jgi:hypothetical protein